MSEWQPIETAPKDVEILCFCPLETPQIVSCIKREFTMLKDDFDWEGIEYTDEALRDIVPTGAEPTHWMPLPEPPK